LIFVAKVRRNYGWFRAQRCNLPAVSDFTEDVRHIIVRNGSVLEILHIKDRQTVVDIAFEGVRILAVHVDKFRHKIRSPGNNEGISEHSNESDALQNIVPDAWKIILSTLL
jgi:hypothetical protein